MKRTVRKSQKPSVKAEVLAIKDEEGCDIVQALTTFGLRAVLAGLSRSAVCREHLVLKGGTALRLRHGRSIGRVSTDIDLSHLDGSERISPDVIIGDVAVETAEVLAETFEDAASIDIRLHEDRSHPKYPEQPAMYSFRLSARASLGGKHVTEANQKLFLLELVIDEWVDRELLEDLVVVVNHLPIRLKAYAPVQAMAEKLRAILQKLQYFEKKGTAASFQPRHVFDLLLLYDQLAPGDLAKLKPVFHRKCEVRLVPPQERTRERLLHPVLYEQMVAADKGGAIAAAAWRRLMELASVVCD